MVQSTAGILPQFRSSARESDFIDVIRHRDDAETLARLRRHDVEFVLPGCELGVQHADRWSETLGLVSNGTHCSAARRNKYLMVEAVREHGLRVPDQFATRRLEDALKWTRGHGRWPVVVKPDASSGSDSVTACQSEEDVTRAFEAIVGRLNVLGTANEHFLVQEFLPGREYIIDTVSYQEHHRLCGVWRYIISAEAEPTVGYDAMWLLDGEGERQERLFEYARGVLDALEIRYGPAHCELKWVDGEPVLVEVGARLTGGTNCWINRHCSGVSQLDLTILAYTTPSRFLRDVDKRYVLKKHAANVFLEPRVSGTLKAMPRLPQIRELESLYRLSISAKLGYPVPRVAGYVTLLHASREAVESDLGRICDLERNGLYEVTS